jgi:hypothetical protein
MSFKMDCPHCAKTLNVTEKAIGKTVPCPSCNQPVKVSQPVQPSREASRVDASPPWSGAAHNGPATPDSQMPLPSGMPPMPPTGGTFDFLNGSADSRGVPRALANVVQGLDVTDMFSGNEKEYVFSLFPGEQRLDELTIHHQHFFIVKSGVTRVTLTTHRLLYTATRVFSPVYWMLLVLFPPLIFYYVIRLSRNRNVALPLGSIDCVEKQYRLHWLWFILAINVGPIVAGLCTAAVAIMFKQSREHASALQMMVYWIVLGLLGPVVLILLLATRMVGFDVRSRGSNRFFVRFSPWDAGVSEERFDAFFQKVHAQMEYTRTLQPQPQSVAT